ncbi:hypothetical protein TRIATDRAFT_319346 [Trichoderma atroviride IMI 206040]|uniref:Uncharacterized protein n=1 Tax=Hypocrea atroviridis (strain ATCC 20476 / IMI 206040) TaxID=452589 RepID=G9NZW9_HYPAI|nr:uncharacterized protein TRIATDRAFT_319346 [Trichoderma atroviride IMI 206040]EHK44016.1 hypothetical protein TRIATDRAFT_319346 [Trichoderma atroviride IMI 206040]
MAATGRSALLQRCNAAVVDGAQSVSERGSFQQVLGDDITYDRLHGGNSGKRPEDAINSELRDIPGAQNRPCSLGQAPIWIGQPCDHASRNAKMALADEYSLIAATMSGGSQSHGAAQ